MIKTIFLAPPGAGKGTQAKKLADKTGAVHLSTGDILRAAVDNGTPAGLEAKPYMNAGGLAPDEIVIQIIQDSLNSSSEKGWILDGFPRNVEQAIALETILDEMGQKDYSVIFFDVSDDVLIQRITGRHEEFGRKDDHPDVVPKRLEVYREKTAPLIEFYEKRGVLKKIDGDRSVDDIFDELLGLLQKVDLVN
jgi:adenylate kinase